MLKKLTSKTYLMLKKFKARKNILTYNVKNINKYIYEYIYNKYNIIYLCQQKRGF